MALSENDWRRLDEKFDKASDGLRDLTRDFNEHKLEDQLLANAIKMNQQVLHDHLESESGSKVRRDQWKLARYAGLFAVGAAIIGSLVLHILELLSRKPH